MTYECPLCGSPLSEKHYHKVVKAQLQEQKTQKGELERLKKQTADARALAIASKQREAALRARTKQQVEAARKEATARERSKSAARDKRMNARIKKLEEERRMSQRHTSPQELGLADEGSLVKRLNKEFPDDRIEHAGKGGDVLHYVLCDEDEAAGCIVYECKRTDRISTEHVLQTARAKKVRNAHYGILVTTGRRRGFGGLDQESGIFLVSQSGVLALARICRDSLVAMAKQRLDADAKAAAAKRLMAYVASPVCKTPLEEAISQAERAHKTLIREMKRHAIDWAVRHEIYQTIRYDVVHVRRNIGRILLGDDPLKLEKPLFEPLALPLK